MKLSIVKVKQITQAHVFNNANEETILTSVHFDSRKLQENSLFFALTIGERDGHSFIGNAVKQGAKAVLISKEGDYIQQYPEVAFLLVPDTLLAFQELARQYRQLLHTPVIAITGSNGKTTTKDLVAALLSFKMRVHKTAGNYNNHLGVPLTILSAEPEHDVWVIEMGMNHAGEIEVLSSIAQPNYAIVTNVGESHIEHLGSREGIAHAKGEIFSHLQKGGKAIIPYDSDFRELLSSKTEEETIYYRVKREEETICSRAVEQGKVILNAYSINLENGRTTFSYIQEPANDISRFFVPLYGEHNVLNCLPAIYLAKEFGFCTEEIREGLKEIIISPMRFQMLEGRSDSLIINDAYNASPTSMKTSIRTFLSLFEDKKRVVVLGDMYELGKDNLSLHSSVGEYLNDYIDQIEILVTVGEHSRTLSDAFKGTKQHFFDKESAIRFLQTFLSPNVSFLFKASRGMKLETMVKELSETTHSITH